MAEKVKLKNRLRQAVHVSLIDETGKECGRLLAPKELTEEIDEETISKPTKSLIRNGHVHIIRKS